MARSLASLAALASLALAGCPADSASDPEVVAVADLEMTVDTAVDDIDEEDGGDVLMDLDVDEEATRAERRQAVIDLLRAMAEEEPCALRGLLGGRYEATEGAEHDGGFGGRAYRRHDTLVAVGEGVWDHADDATGGTLEGAWAAFEGGEGDISGTWAPAEQIEGIALGTFAGSWAPSDDSHEGGNIAGLWHPTQDGRGLFLGYWSRCDVEPAE